MTGKNLALLACLAAYAALVLALTGPPALGWNEASRLATVQMVVEEGTLVIDNSVFESGDKCYFRGNFYSDKPPLPSLLGIVAYAPLYHVFGISFADNMDLAYRIVTFAVEGLPLCVLILLFYLALGAIDFNAADHESLMPVPLRQVYRIGLTVVLAFGTLLLGYGTVFNNHVLGAALLFGAFYAALSVSRQQEGSTFWKPFIAGLCAGAAVASDLSAGLFAVLFLLFLASRHRDFAYAYTWGLIPPALVFMLMNVQVTGDILPAYLHPEGYDFPGSQMATTLGGSRPTDSGRLTYLVLSQIGVEGFLSNTPILLAGLWGAFLTGLSRRFGVLKPLAWVVLTGFLTASLFYAFRSSNFGGHSFGFRYLLPLTPLLLYFAGPLLTFRRAQWWSSRMVLILLAAVSVFFAALCAVDPWLPTSAHIRNTANRISPGLSDRLTETYREWVGRPGMGHHEARDVQAPGHNNGDEPGEAP